MNILVVKIAEHFGKEVLKGAVYAAAITGATQLAAAIVDKYFAAPYEVGNEDPKSNVVVNVIFNKDGVEVSREVLGEQEMEDDEECCDGDCDACDCNGVC